MTEAALPERRRTKRVRFSEKNDVHVFEANLTDTNSGIHAAQLGMELGGSTEEEADAPNEDVVDLHQEHEQVAHKIGKLREWSSHPHTSDINFEHSDDDQDPEFDSNPAYVESPSAHAWDGRGPRACRQSAAFAYQRGPSLPRGSIMSDLISPDDSGPLAGMSEEYIKSVRGAQMCYDELTPHAAQQTSGGAIRDGTCIEGDSMLTTPTDCMDTGMSSPKYGGEQYAVAAAQSKLHQQEATTSRPGTPEIREDSWSCGTAREDTRERLQDITGATSAPVSSAPSNRDGTSHRPARRSMVSDRPRESLACERPALAPRTSLEPTSVPQLSGAGRVTNENQTEDLLDGEIRIDRSFVKAGVPTEDQNGATARLLHLDVQDESLGDQLLDIEAEQVDDTEYLLKSMDVPEEQMPASRKTAGSVRTGSKIAEEPPRNKDVTGTKRGHTSMTPSSYAQTAPSLLTPTKDVPGGTDVLRHKSPSGQRSVKRHRGPPSSPLRQMSSRLRTTTPKSPFPTTGTPLHTIKEEPGSPALSPKPSERNVLSPDRQTPLRILPFMSTPSEVHSRGVDEDEMCQLSTCGELLQRTPPAQAPATMASAMDWPGGHVPVSPGRTPLSPLAAVSTHAFMQLTRMQHEFDACKLSKTTAGAVMSMQALTSFSDLKDTGERMDDCKGAYGSTMSRAMNHAYGSAMQTLWRQSGTAQQQMVDMLKHIEHEISRNPPSVYHSFKYASSDEQGGIKRKMTEHLDDAKKEAISMITKMLQKCHDTGHEYVTELTLRTKPRLLEDREAQKALCANAPLVKRTCDAVVEQRKRLTELSHALCYRCKTALADVEASQSLVQEVKPKLQHTQDVIEETEAEIEFKADALNRIRCEREKKLQDLQAAEEERLQYEELRNRFVQFCDDTGCLLKKARTYEWNGDMCTEVTWEVTDCVMCILRFTEACPRPAVFLRYHSGQTADDLKFKLLLESSLELDPTDGRCEMAEEHVTGPPSEILKWSKDVVIQLEALALEVARLPMNVHMAIASDVTVGGKIQVNFLCVARGVEVSLTFAVAVAATCANDKLLTVNLEEVGHITQKSCMADLVEAELSSFRQPGYGKRFITNACLDLRAALVPGP